MRESLVFKTIAGGSIALCSFCFGGFDITFQTLLFFLLADFITGTYKAFCRQEISSQASWKGFGKKILTLLVVAIAVRIDALMGSDGIVRGIALYGYIGTELYSITENIIALGVPIPPALAKYFKQYTGELKKDEK